MEIHPGIYNRFIDPLMESTRERISKHIHADDSVLDIACGTGELARSLQTRCRRVTGIDLDERMIGYAKNHSISNPVNSISFEYMDAKELRSFDESEFTVASMSLALHQFDPSETDKILDEAERVSSRLIITDYSYPLPVGYKKLLLHIIERMAGRIHYRNFRSFLEKGGVPGIMKDRNRKIVHQEISGSGAFTLYIIKNGS